MEAERNLPRSHETTGETGELLVAGCNEPRNEKGLNAL